MMHTNHNSSIKVISTTPRMLVECACFVIELDTRLIFIIINMDISTSTKTNPPLVQVKLRSILILNQMIDLEMFHLQITRRLYHKLNMNSLSTCFNSQMCHHLLLIQPPIRFPLVLLINLQVLYVILLLISVCFLIHGS